LVANSNQVPNGTRLQALEHLQFRRVELQTPPCARRGLQRLFPPGGVAKVGLALERTAIWVCDG
jgi:hypothetical protein